MFPAVSLKWLGRGFLLNFLLILVLAVPVFAATGTVIGTGVNVRKSNSLDSEVHTQLNSGVSVDVIELEGDFYRINYDNMELYISKDFVTTESSSSGKVNANSVNIRKYPSTNHEVLSQADAGETFEVIGKMGEWIHITYEGEGAFIHRDYIDVPSIENIREVVVDIPADEVSLGLVTPAALKDEFYAVVTASGGLKLREMPSVEANVITTYSNGTTLDIIADNGDWIKVSLDGKIGYMASEFLSVKAGKRPENSRSMRIIDYAKKFIGTPYVWGGTNLEKGVDCSGFVYSVMKNFGITLNRGSMYQYSNGVPVKKDELLVGDLVFFDTDMNGGISHVGIYMGGGQFIHSSSSKKTWGVTISSLYESYYVRVYYGACRIL